MLRAALEPLSWLYAAAGAARIARGKPERCGVPVICIGNLTVGGTGKTPVTRTLRAMLARHGVEAHALSLGYGGALKGPVRVDPTIHTARDVGDEPLLHAVDGPAWIARDRSAGARAAVEAGARLIVMDDGFQNPALAKDLSLLVFDAVAGIGNQSVFPAGPLREPLSLGLKRSDGAILIGDAAVRPQWLDGYDKPVLFAALEPLTPPPPGPLFAFAGIGRPTKFFDTLTRHGAALADGAAFPDHHVYDEADLRRLAQLAEAHDARLITTEKDHVRLPAVWRERVATLPVSARFKDEDEATLKTMLERLAP
jgi:tetraacyldisaccharide 4'-kinase